ncbi:MAG: PmbA protein [Bacteriovoracaceae bacterium]|jgi:PmbA protein
MKTELKNTLEKIINFSNDFGADQCDAILSKGESFSLSAQNSEIDKYKVSGAQVIGVRAIKDSKVGISYTESFDEESLKIAAKSAVENAINSEVNEFEKINTTEGEFIFESEFQKDTTSTEEKIEFCLKLESEVKARDSRVQSVPYNGLSESESASYYLNSNGVLGYSSEYYQSCYTSALLQEGAESSMHYHGVIGRKLSDLNVDECVTESLTHASEWMKAKPLSTGNYDIIFELDAFSEILGCFSSIFSGKGAMEKTNPFLEKMGKQVAGSGITISDIPKYKEAFFVSHFDSEGIPHKDLTLIENGVLKSFYHNSATANYFKLSSTGHASRGAKSALGVGGTTKVISAGNTSASDIVSGEYFEVHSLQGLHSGANSVSGEFSFAASGYLCREGKRVQPVKGVTVSGNFHKMLLDINIIGDSVLSTHDRGFFSPKLRFENMSVAGA